MLEALCGNKNVQRVLLFLFVNGRCYGAQLQRAFGAALTPIQKALSRLERGGLLTSYYEGKTRLYQLNPAYALLSELELLLKKAYTLLPAQEKKGYYVIKEEFTVSPAAQETKLQTLLVFWDKLLGITRLTFHAKTRSKEENGWNGKGDGEVTLKKEGPYCVIFQEKGSWQGKQASEVSFTNTFRWTLDRTRGVISLEHLRRGTERPVFLFDLAPSGQSSLSSVDSHLCEGDIYFGQIRFDRSSFRLNWRVIGPKKNEEIDYYYM